MQVYTYIILLLVLAPVLIHGLELVVVNINYTLDLALKV